MNPEQLPDQVQHANIIPAPVPGAPLQPVQLPDGRWVYAPQPQPIVVQVPVADRSVPPWLRDLIVVTFLILAVVAVCCSAICGIVVLAGGTLIGIIGAVGSNLPMVGITLTGVLLAAGWAASKAKGNISTKK